MLLPKRYTLDELMALIDEPQRSKCQQIMIDHGELIGRAPGSSHNHHAWPGGYLDHVVETMNLAVLLYDPLNDARPLDFSLSEALVVMFLHDLEKPWKYVPSDSPEMQVGASKEERKLFRERMVERYGFDLSPAQTNAMLYVEGEFVDYRADHRAAGPLAALCNACDNLSARMWFDCPLAKDDPWLGAARSLS